jgi:hypothetical protein
MGIQGSLAVLARANCAATKKPVAIQGDWLSENVF